MLFNVYSTDDFITPQQASVIGSDFLGKKITIENITYLINYGRVQNFGTNNSVLISKNELYNYYKTQKSRITEWKNKLGNDLNWALSFDQYKESETTKHVHRLHPYKGKFIPQLVEYFLDEKTDHFKTQNFFNKGDIILDPFCGSGTTIIQANELGINAIGLDISAFNCYLTSAKIKQVNLNALNQAIKSITPKLLARQNEQVKKYDEELTLLLSGYNNKYFPAPNFVQMVKNKGFDKNNYVTENFAKFYEASQALAQKHQINLKPLNNGNFLSKWYNSYILDEIEYCKSLIEQEDKGLHAILFVILSRTIRSCRATTHYDLGTLVEPIYECYYCDKHNKICKPILTITKWWQSYTKDTIQRLVEFDDLRTDAEWRVYQGDSSSIDINYQLNNDNEWRARLGNRAIDGIFCSPPYVGLIDYHEQHAYAYELLGIKRYDSLEIGSMKKGNNKQSVALYIDNMAKVLKNCKPALKESAELFIVANDKHRIYPTICERSGFRIINEFKRPVLNRSEKDKSPYCEIIFHLRKNDE